MLSKSLMIIILAAVIGGGVPVLGKIALHQIPPLSFTLIRFFLASIFMVPLFLKSKPKLDKYFLNAFLISILAVLNVVFFAYGIRLTDATISQMLYTSVPIIAVIFSILVLKERLTKQKITGVLLGFVGALLIVISPIIIKGQSDQMSFLGNIIICLAVFSFSLYTVLSKSVQKHLSPIQLTSMFVILTTLIMIPLSLTEVSSYPNWWQSLSLQSILSTMYVGIAGTFIYYSLYQYAIKHGSPVIASMTLYLQPIATYFWAYFLLGEKLNLYFILGAILVFLGAWVITRPFGKD